MTKKQRIFCGVLLALLSILFVACKHEPETAVPPIITIEPTLIMRTFSGSATFYGTAKGVRDDLQVTIKDFATEPTITANEYRFATSVENGRWSFTIDTVNGTTCTDGRTVQLADGCYELTVTAIATSTVLGVSGMYVFAKAPFLVENTQNGNVIPEKYCDHQLKPSKDFKNCRELHIEPDWLLIYKYSNENVILYLVRTGTHSDLFK